MNMIKLKLQTNHGPFYYLRDFDIKCCTHVAVVEIFPLDGNHQGEETSRPERPHSTM